MFVAQASILLMASSHKAIPGGKDPLELIVNVLPSGWPSAAYCGELSV